jgi:endoplasmic reticulum-Golgi intermediate compartment protein 3
MDSSSKGSTRGGGGGGGYDASFSYAGGYQQPNGSYGGYAAPSSSYNPPLQQSSNHGNGASSSLRRRNADDDYSSTMQRQAPVRPGGSSNRNKTMVKKLDFMFPKVDSEYTVRGTQQGGLVSLIGYGLILVLGLAEILSWRSQRIGTVEHIVVDTNSLGKTMRVNLDITFPALACEDLHIDIMDVAGDSQLDVEETMVKQRLNRKGLAMGKDEIVAANVHQTKLIEKKEILAEPLPADYCGPCYGAHETDDQCCNTCDALLEAYQKKRWRTDLVKLSSEQCIREGRDKVDAKPLKRGEGCQLSGYFMVNRVGGNFHIAMGEGVERDGRHIHTFNPEESPNFNASHVINHLSFGPYLEQYNQNGEHTALNGVSKIVQNEHGTTGLFQYFLKIVPTTYVDNNSNEKAVVETNRFYFTERFRPLMAEYYKEDDYSEDSGKVIEGADEEVNSNNKVAVVAGHAKHHGHADHHAVRKNSILPGVFFIYEIYPFEVQVSPATVPITHLLIRLMATIGGVFTVVKWADALLHFLSGGGGGRDNRIRSGGGVGRGFV